MHLSPPGSIEETSRQFCDLGFKVIPGGEHVGGLTANALVVFADGLYLELLSFKHEPSHYPPGSPARIKRDTHPWANKPLGWIDYAFLGNGLHTIRISDIINDRAKKDGSGAFYEAEENGGRKRTDGKVVRWLISTPQENKGTLPFFCGDITPRDLRVPTKPPANVQHPSTTQGIAHIRIVTDAKSFPVISKQLTSVTGQEPLSCTPIEAVWSLDSHSTTSPRLILSTPSIELESALAKNVGTGIVEVGFLVKKKQDDDRHSTPYGRIVWVSEGHDD